MGNACHTNDYVFDFNNNSYYKVKFDNNYLLILNLTEAGNFRPYSYIGVSEKNLRPVQNYIFELTVSRKTTMARDCEKKNEQLRKVSRECIMDVYRKTKFYKKEHENLINQIEIHYIKGDPQILEKYKMNIKLEDFIEKYIRFSRKKVTFIEEPRIEEKRIDLESYINSVTHDL